MSNITENIMDGDVSIKNFLHNLMMFLKQPSLFP